MNTIPEAFNFLKEYDISNSLNKIVKIQKIYNWKIYKTVSGELQDLLAKYPSKRAFDLMRHLFHGTRLNNPQMIYSTETGFDNRFANNGLNGDGIYFADNFKYSKDYRYDCGDGTFQIFLALVLTGESTTLKDPNPRLPALKPGSLVDRYDSFNNGNGGHYVIFDNLKCYPGYLITYKQ